MKLVLIKSYFLFCFGNSFKLVKVQPYLLQIPQLSSVGTGLRKALFLELSVYFQTSQAIAASGILLLPNVQ